MTKKLLMLVCSVMLVFGACSSTKDKATDNAKIFNIEWKMQSVKAKDNNSLVIPQPEKMPTMTIATDGTSVSGYAGCNRYSGPVTIKGAKVTFGALAATKMFCMDSMDVESALFNAFAEADSYALVNGELLLKKGNVTLATFAVQ